MAYKRKAKLGVIGCGELTTGDLFGHLKYISELHQGGYLELAAVCDAVEQKARVTGEKYNVPYYTDLEKMLSTDLDCVYIATPDYTHHYICKIAAEHGKHFVVEKPMAISLSCCDVIINAAKKAGVYFEVAENYFRTPNERVIKMAIQKGLIGDVRRVYVIPGSLRMQSRPATRDFCWLVSGTVSLHDMGVHQMSQLKTFAISNPSFVRGTIQKGKGGWPEWGLAEVEFENGVIGVIEDTFGEGAVETPYRKVVGTNGCIYSFGIFCGASDMGGSMKILLVDDSGKVQEVPIVKKVRQIGDKSYLDSITLETKPEITYTNPYRDCVSGEWGVGVAEEIMSIANAAVNDIPPEYGIEGRKDLEMTIAMIESGLTNHPVKLPIEYETSWEKTLHEAYKKHFGKDPLKI